MNFRQSRIAAAACLCVAQSAWAQGASAVNTLPSVEVRAQAVPPLLRTSNLATGSAGSSMDTPFSTSSVPADVLRAQAGTSLQDALRNVPGVQADTGFNGSHTQFFSMRGAIADSGTGSNRVLRDGVRLSNYPFAQAFVESVDVLRGPGAAIGVRSEPGGTVNLATKQPQMANFGSAGLSVGTANAMLLSVDINRVLSAENELAARAIVTRSASSEWRNVPDKLDGLKLGIAKSDGNRYHLRAGVEVTNQTYQPDYGLPAVNGRLVDIPRDRQLGEPWADSTTNNRIVDLHGDVALSATTRLNVDFTHLDAHSTSVKSFVSNSSLPVTAANPFGTVSRGAGFEPSTDRAIDSLATSVSSVQSVGGLTHRLFAGLDYYKETLNQPNLTIPAANSPSINVFNPVFGLVRAPAAGVALAQSLTTQKLESLAASLQDQVDIGAWTLVGGLRFTQQKFLYGGAGTTAVDESVWSPKLGVLRRLSDTSSVYANVATGMAPNQVSSSTNQSLPSRRSAQVELGWKALWNSGKLASDLAIYQLDQTNMISSDETTPLNIFDFKVDGTGRSQGLEASLAGNLTDRLTVRAAYAYTDARVLDNSLLAGKIAPNISVHALSLWGQYQWQVASDTQWLTGVGLYTQSDRWADRANTVTLPGYARVDLTQTWRKPVGKGQSVEVQLAVRNLFDASYYVSSHLHVARWMTPGQGRNVALSANYSF